MEDTRKTLLEDQFDAVSEVEPTLATAEPVAESPARTRD